LVRSARQLPNSAFGVKKYVSLLARARKPVLALNDLEDRKHKKNCWYATRKPRRIQMSIRSIPRAALLASTLLASTSIPALADDVTSQRLMNPDKEPQNWLMVNKDYSARRYSELDLINKDNVKNLQIFT
jgi:hypothetical protein